MSLAFAHRAPTPQEVERLRLILSTYQDGTGMLAAPNGRTLPGWRDFERAVALTFTGTGSENKAIFDVLLSHEADPKQHYGLSCKMRKELDRIGRDGRVTLELSNSASQFWDRLATRGITTENYQQRGSEVGQMLLEQVEHWHQAASMDGGGTVDLSKSFYLALSWNKRGIYQLHQFALKLPSANALNWYFPSKLIKGKPITARHINGDNEHGRVFEWYGESGGQLNYYPLASSAVWQSEPFLLEPLPDTEHGVLAKVAAYFPNLWIAASR